MPREKFYNPMCIEGCEYEAARGDMLAISWGSDHPGVQIAGFPIDRSGINRMIHVLRKARDQSFGADA